MNGSGSLNDTVSRFDAALESKLSAKAVGGAPEDQLRAPFERLVTDLAAVLLFKVGDVVPVGESTLSALKAHLDYAVKVQNALRRLRGSQSARQGRRPAPFQGRARPRSVGQAEVPAEPHVHGRQPVLARAWRRNRGRGSAAGGRRGNGRRQAGRLAWTGAPVRRLPALGANFCPRQQVALPK